MAIESHDIEYECRSKLGTVQIIHHFWPVPPDGLVAAEGECILDLSLTPRLPNARGCFPDCWSTDRYEHIGRLFFIPAGYALRGAADSGEQSSLTCMLDTAAVQEWFEGVPFWTDHTLEASLNVSSKPVFDLLKKLSAELRTPGFASEAMIELLFVQLAISLARHYHHMECPSTIGGLASWQMKRIDERLAESDAGPTLEELSTLCGISVRHLSRAFRTTFGASIGEYLCEKRIEAAKRLLRGDHGIKEIAHAIGFSSPSAFSFAFQRETGESPGQYRRQSKPRVH